MSLIERVVPLQYDCAGQAFLFIMTHGQAAFFFDFFLGQLDPRVDP